MQSQQSAWVCRTAAPGEQIALRGPVASKLSPLGRVRPEAQARVPVASQVQLERIRQAGSLERIRAILNDTKLTDINQLPET